MIAKKCPHCGHYGVVIKHSVHVARWTPDREAPHCFIVSKYQWCQNCNLRFSEQSKVSEYYQEIDSDTNTVCPQCNSTISHFLKVSETTTILQILSKCYLSKKFQCPQCLETVATDEMEAKIVFCCPSLVRKVEWKRMKVRELLVELPLAFLEALEHGDVEKATERFAHLNRKTKLKALQISKLVPEIHVSLLAVAI